MLRNLSTGEQAMSPTAAIISGAIALLALVIFIFGAAWLNQRATEKLIDQMSARFDTRFAAVEQRLDRIERQLEAIFKPIIPQTP
jgi:uncharacterized membrane protein YfbV (UPF0208 family)